MNVKAFIKKYTMVLALVVVFIFFTILTDGKLVLAQNISNLLLQNAYVLVMACGMLLCILTGGNVDLSVGSTLCLSAALAAKIMDMGKSPFLAILVSLAVSIVIGIWQGWLIGYIHIPKTNTFEKHRHHSSFIHFHGFCCGSGSPPSRPAVSCPGSSTGRCASSSGPPRPL